MKHKNIYLSSVIVLIIILCVFFYVFANKSPKDTREIRIGYNFESVNNALLIIAFEEKYFEKYNIHPQMLPLKGGDEVRQALLANQIDVGMGGFPNFLPAISKGAPLKIIAPGVESSAYVFVRPDSAIKNLKDLDGKTIVSSIPGATYTIFRIILDKEGVNINNAKFINIDKAYQAISLMGNKTADAVIVSAQDAVGMRKSGAVLLKEWEEKGYQKELLPTNILAGRVEFINQNTSLTSDFLKAIADSHRLISTNPDEAARIVSSHTEKMSDGTIKRLPEEIANQWKKGEIVNVAWIDPSIIMGMVKEAREAGLIDKDLKLDDVFDLRFSEQEKNDQYSIYEKNKNIKSKIQ